MENLNITKGKWVIVDDYTKPSFELLFLGEGTQQTANVYGLNAKANADLICEAGNVANETGLTPRELLNQRNELLEWLEEIKLWGSLKGNKFTYTTSKEIYLEIEKAIANTTK